MLTGAGLAGRRHHDLAYRFFASARPVHLVGDAAYIGKPLQGLPAQVTVTARLRCDAALYQPAPPPTGRPGRPRLKGDRLPELIVLAALTRYQWTPVQVRCYGKTLEREVLAIRCVWYGALKGQPVQVILSRPIGSPDGYQLALVTTDLAATPQQVIERYSDRWPEEMVFPQLAKARVRALGCGGQRVADLDLAVGHDHPVDEQLH